MGNKERMNAHHIKSWRIRIQAVLSEQTKLIVEGKADEVISDPFWCELELKAERDIERGQVILGNLTTIKYSAREKELFPWATKRKEEPSLYFPKPAPSKPALYISSEDSFVVTNTFIARLKNLKKYPE